MAKAMPSLSLLEMESKIGYEVDSSSTDAGERLKRFYSDLRQVPQSTYQRTKNEFEEFENHEYQKDHHVISGEGALETSLIEEISHGESSIKLTCSSPVARYGFDVDVHYDFGLDLPLLFNRNEARRITSIAKLQPTRICNTNSSFFKLPKEIRDKIFLFALPKRKCKIEDTDSRDGFDFPGGLGDPDGFYFPLDNKLTVLMVDRQMRQEALPHAYRTTTFHLVDMDNLIKFLMAVGTTGRSNIGSLMFAWESRADSERKWENSSASEDIISTLPTLHSARCVQLLKQCKRLESLRICFETDLIIDVCADSFKANPGIRQLCSIRGIKQVEVWDLGYRPLDTEGLAKWLKEQMESATEDGETNEGRGT